MDKKIKLLEHLFYRKFAIENDLYKMEDELIAFDTESNQKAHERQKVDLKNQISFIQKAIELAV